MRSMSSAPTSVPFADLTRVNSPLKDEILKRIGAIIDRSSYVLGPEVEAFEKDFAKFVGTPHCLGLNSGLDALKLALEALGVGPGDEVITSANTFIATAYAISQVGAKPVLVDCEDRAWNLDPTKLEQAITPRTKAIMPVHLYGQPADMDPILAIAKKHGIPVIEDSAQSHGATYKGRACGTMGVMGCFSFYPGKNLGAMGEGGAVTTSDDGLREKIRMLRDVGQKTKYVHEVIGSNSRIHTFQAAVLGAKLPGLKAQNDDRNRVAKRYGELLGGLKAIRLPEALADRTHVYHLYVIETLGKKSGAKERDELKQFLADRKITALIHYPTPIHLQKCYANLGYPRGTFPVAERLGGAILSLPMFPFMREDEIVAVADAVKAFYG